MKAVDVIYVENNNETKTTAKVNEILADKAEKLINNGYALKRITMYTESSEFGAEVKFYGYGVFNNETGKGISYAVSMVDADGYFDWVIANAYDMVFDK
jgi:hypothetical protein